MFSLHSFLNPEYDSEVLQKLVDRMARARWIEGALVTRDPFSIKWSAMGSQRLAAIEKAMEKCSPGIIAKIIAGNAKKMGVFRYLVMMALIDRIARDLKPPRLSSIEYKTLFMLVVSEARQRMFAQREVPPENRRGRFRQ